MEKRPGKVCGSKGFPQEGGQVYCIGCKTVYPHKPCEHCGEPVPFDAYRPSSFLAGLFGG